MTEITPILKLTPGMQEINRKIVLLFTLGGKLDFRVFNTYANRVKRVVTHAMHLATIEAASCCSLKMVYFHH